MPLRLFLPAGASAVSTTLWPPVSGVCRASSTSSPPNRRSPRRSNRAATRTYATVNHRHEGPEQHRWPQLRKGQQCPTPYQIFDMDHNAEYCKARFYELVKMYHPDRSPGTRSGNSQATRNERYRLIVAANAILSDPTKRCAYDRFGAGWNDRDEAGRSPQPRSYSTHHSRPSPFSSEWRDSRQHDPIWQNATWEDWERFYRRRAQREAGESEAESSSRYTSNATFFLLVTLVALIGSSANYTRMEHLGAQMVHQRDILHDRAARELRMVRQEAADGRDRDERIQWFVRNRDASLQVAGSDVEVLRQERRERMLPRPDVCQSEEITEREFQG